MKYVIVGGDAAGMSAAMQIVRNDEEAEIITLERGGIYSYAQCGLPYALSGKIESTEHLIARDIETFREKYGIDARVYHDVEKVDPEEKIVYGTDHESGEHFSISYDRCLIATGANPITPPWEGRDLKGIHHLKTIPDAQNILHDLDESVKDVTIIGGGYIGLEVAENMKQIGKQVRIIDMADRLAPMFDEEVSEAILKEAERNDVTCLLNEKVTHFSGSERVKSVHTDKGRYETDLVVIATGVKPNTDIIKDTEVQLHESGAIRINAYMETNSKDLYAAGDCATQFHRLKQKDDFIPLGTHANKQGRIAGVNMIGYASTFKGIVGTAILKFFDLTIGKTGLTTHEAMSLNIDYGYSSFKGEANAGYYPGKDPLTLHMTYEKGSDRLLGIQAVGRDGVDKRIDVAATALFHNMTANELENLDLSYAPPYNAVWDPLQQAARRR
ncbi:FAD-dependent oxidoreductase [Texcoconibacillus texcoconensis]|uniref:NADPH-dependent 2,4-dienoyl-CoA reductase/sulfur reductase-like enzyme n=1 Tax=Texcoconibacillus texcoconensis TaxID=1095777 RepID=A0A840QRZ7_9BACI|nr:FAD-dependent oxidoreductase [Texcoconibacillus texcoconensis]MBB5174093.1 NADPH-dependent 2,4-dienoyl-CoA reductase/sulfur reductase-like enzyme [Texcoconibacillus texcoconensis]